MEIHFCWFQSTMRPFGGFCAMFWWILVCEIYRNKGFMKTKITDLRETHQNKARNILCHFLFRWVSLRSVPLTNRNRIQFGLCSSYFSCCLTFSPDFMYLRGNEVPLVTLTNGSTSSSECGKVIRNYFTYVADFSQY